MPKGTMKIFLSWDRVPQDLQQAVFQAVADEIQSHADYGFESEIQDPIEAEEFESLVNDVLHDIAYGLYMQLHYKFDTPAPKSPPPIT